MSFNTAGSSPGEIAGFFLAARYVFVLLYGVWVFYLFRRPRPWLLVAGSILFSLYTLLVIQAPLKRLYAMDPPMDRILNVAMAATAATGHSPFESYQVGAADLEPFWRLVTRVASLGKPENVLVIYPFLPALVLVLLPLSLHFGLRSDSSYGRRWETAFIVYSVLLLSSSPQEKFGVFDPFWPMNFLLKPNHVLGFVILPWWMRAWTSPRPLVRTLVAGLLLGVLAWVFLMHWIYLLAGLLVYPLVARRAGHPAEAGRVSVVAGVSLFAALPYALFLFKNFHWGHRGAVAEKVWLQFGYEEGFYNVFSVGYEHGVLFLLSLAGIGAMAARRRTDDLVWLSLLAGCLAGWAGYLVAFQLQKIIEPDEFYFYSRFLLSVAAGTGAFHLLKKAGTLLGGSISEPLNPRALSLFLLLMLPQSFPYWWNPREMDRYYHLALDPIPEEMSRLGQWAREKTSADDVFVAGPRTSIWIAALSGRRVLTTGHHRPTFDYEERRELERRMVVESRRQAFVEARSRYGVTHIAVDAELLSAVGVGEVGLDSLPWLEKVYRSETVEVFAIRGDAIGRQGSGKAPGAAGKR